MWELVLFIIGIVIFIIVLIAIEFELSEGEDVSLLLWIGLFVSIFIVIISFGIYLYNVPVTSYNLVTTQQNWDHCQQPIIVDHSVKPTHRPLPHELKTHTVHIVSI